MFRYGIFLGELRCAGALRLKGISVSIDQLRVVARGGERAPRCQLGGDCRRLYFPRAPFTLCLSRELGGCAGLPITDDFQICSAHEPLIESNPLRIRQQQKILLAAPAHGLGASRGVARADGALGALAERSGVAIDPLLTQPAQGLERITVSHEPESSKAPQRSSPLAILRPISAASTRKPEH